VKDLSAQKSTLETCGGIHTVVPLPPSKRALADQKVEQESKNEPQRVLRRVGGRDVASGVEEDGHVDVAHPAAGVPAVDAVDGNGDDGANEEKVHDAVVHLAGLEHALRADAAPDERRVVDHLGAGAREALGVFGAAEVGDVANHPAQDSRLGRGGEDGGVDLADEEDPGRDLHVLAELEVLRKVHAVLDRVVAVALDHHVGNGLAGPGVVPSRIPSGMINVTPMPKHTTIKPQTGSPESQ
jgi:hypothetical protein